ncbi:hypothetical protein FUA48_12020 [Flavobacterium alkalisoli]|uniref:Arm DNA-binding domain-containing protein n=1 Tax=Flavobacterium alkalisoli TaxID=2602769 RepID=A0A5B9FWW0_9FLAO|nr:MULTISPECIES: Arm DNA-binding domain-containing protein [Flavobacterium]QEE50278.1 hypothetical protein FUA48_12020 [Flavobacterium alkalisoli]
MGYFYVKGIIRTDKQRRNGTCPLYVRVSVKGKIIKIPLGICGSVAKWDPLSVKTGSGHRCSCTTRYCTDHKSVI